MGYRSQVQMLVAGKRGEVFELLHWMGVQKINAGDDKYLENHWGNLIRMQVMVDDGVEKYCTEKELGFAFGRLGEEISDVDLRDNGLGLYTYYSRKFDEPFSNY